MTQYQLGLALGYTGTVAAKQMVYQWETGRRRIPPNKVKSLLKVLLSADPVHAAALTGLHLPTLKTPIFFGVFKLGQYNSIDLEICRLTLNLLTLNLRITFKSARRITS